MTIPFIAELEQQRLQNTELRKQIENMAANSGQDAGTKPIPRPQGTAGTNFSIQEAMGLAGSTKKYETYKAIQVRRACCGDPVTMTRILTAKPSRPCNERTYKLGSSLGTGPSAGQGQAVRSCEYRNHA